ncbi:MAG: acyltransferase [Bacilli bacterium]|jgi:acetyltransferase-like isoleucine patch superfamily enzyme
MNSFLSKEELKSLGLKSYGENVLISRFARIYSADKISIGSNVRIDDFCLLSGKINLGNNIHIAAYAAMFAGDAGIVMEDFSCLSSRVTVYAITDDYLGDYLTNSTIPSKYKNIISKEVIIKKHVLIGASSVVLPGVVLEEGSSFGAMSFINKSSLPWTVNIGQPARVLKERSKKLLLLEEKYLSEKKNEKN